MIKMIIKLLLIALVIYAAYIVINGKYNVFNSNILYDENKVIYNDDEQISKIKMTLSYSQLEIDEGEKIEIETNNKNVKLKSKDGKLTIEEEELRITLKARKSIIKITLPKDYSLDNFDLTSGAGDIEIDNLTVKELNLKLGAGNLEVDNLVVTDKAKINGGAGNLKFDNTEFYNLNFAIGAGQCKIEGIFKGNNEIKAGVGELNIKLLNDIENYKIKLEKGIGNIYVNGENVGDEYSKGTGASSLTVKGGVGNISIDQKKKIK